MHLRVQRVFVHLTSLDDFVGALVSACPGLTVRPLNGIPAMSALIQPGETDRVERQIRAGQAEAPRCAVVAEVEGGVLARRCADRRAADKKVQHRVFRARRGRGGLRRLALSRCGCGDTRHGPAGVFTGTWAGPSQPPRARLRGVLVNEVPTWQADHCRTAASATPGNTREGPPYARAGDDRAPASWSSRA